MVEVISSIPHKQRMELFKKFYISAIEEAMDHPWQLSSGFGSGHKQEELIKICKKLSGIKYWTLTNCCSDSLQIAILTLTKPNDLILIPAFGWISAANAASILNRRIKFIDIDENGTINLDKVKNHLQHEEIPTAIIVIHFFGKMINITKDLQQLTQPYNIKIIEDAATTFYMEEPYTYIPGTSSDIVCYSFDFTKSPSTIGSGGGIATNEYSYYEKIELLTNQGIELKSKKFINNGIKSYMDNISCSILSLDIQLHYKYKLRAKKVNNAVYYKKHIKYPTISGENYIYDRYTIKLPDKEKRDELLIILKENKILTISSDSLLISEIPYYKTKYEYPEAIKFSETTILLPCHPYLNKEHLKKVVEVVNSC